MHTIEQLREMAESQDIEQLSKIVIEATDYETSVNAMLFVNIASSYIQRDASKDVNWSDDTSIEVYCLRTAWARELQQKAQAAWEVIREKTWGTTI